MYYGISQILVDGDTILVLFWSFLELTVKIVYSFFQLVDLMCHFLRIFKQLVHIIAIFYRCTLLGWGSSLAMCLVFLTHNLQPLLHLLDMRARTIQLFIKYFSGNLIIKIANVLDHLFFLPNNLLQFCNLVMELVDLLLPTVLLCRAIPIAFVLLLQASHFLF